MINKFYLPVIIAIILAAPCFAYDYYEAGKLEYKKSNYQQASNYLQKALQKTPNHTKCRYYYAQTLISMKKFKPAQQEYERIIEIAPQSQEARLAAIGIAEIKKYWLIKKGKLYASNINKNSGNKFNITTPGDNYISNALESGKVTRWNTKKMPIKIYIKKSVNTAGYRDFYFTETKKAINAWANNVNESLLSCKFVDNPQEANIQIYFVSEIMKKTGKGFIVGLATPHTKLHLLHYFDIKLVTQRPDGRTFTKKEMYMTALHELGHALGIRGHSSKKEDIMHASGDTNPKNIDSGLSRRDINTLTLLYTLDPDISNFDKGEKAVKHSKKNDKFLGAHEERLKQKLQEALDYTKKFPNNVLSWSQLGKAYYDLEIYGNAVKSFNSALKIDPLYVNAIETLAFTYKDMKDFDKASTQFEKLIDIEPTNINFSHNYILFLIENKRYDTAKTVLYALLIRNPKSVEHSEIKKMQNYLNKM